MAKIDRTIPHHWLSLTLLFLAGLSFSCSVGAMEELDLLEEFGIEVFQTDPSRQAELEEQKRLEAEAALPEHIYPETLAADEALENINLETPTEPSWEPVEAEITLTSYDSKECCLRAIRSTRYEAEMKCRDANKHIWQIASSPVDDAGEESIKQHKLCHVYHNNIDAKALAAAQAQNQNEGNAGPPDYFRCKARSVARCFDATAENASFIVEPK